MEEDMIKKLLIGLFVMNMIFAANSFCYAQMNTEAKLNVYSNELVSPLYYDVKTGETLNLEINNNSKDKIMFKVPLMNIAVDVPKNSKIIVPVSFTNPPAKDIWFMVGQEGSNNKSGTFKVIDYTVNVPTSNVAGIDTSPLSDIINYDTTFVYEEKPEPVYNVTPYVPTYDTTSTTTYSPVEKPIYTEPEPAPVTKPVQAPSRGGYVRGYW
jgi:hypothetical protein